MALGLRTIIIFYGVVALALGLLGLVFALKQLKQLLIELLLHGPELPARGLTGDVFFVEVELEAEIDTKSS